jgi:hypothetical protein
MRDTQFLGAFFIAACSIYTTSLLSTNDGGMDASVDSGLDASDAQVSIGCRGLATNVVFCDDFDEGGVATRLPALNGTGTVAIDDAAYVSPPASFRSDVPATDAATYAEAWGRGNFGAYPHVRVSARFAVAPLQSAVLLMTVYLGINNSVSLFAWPAGDVFLAEGYTTDAGTPGVAYHNHSLVKFDDDAFHAISIDMDIPNASLSFSIDGKVIETGPFQAPGWKVDNGVVQYGIHYLYGPHQEETVHVDDVIVESLP